MRHVLVFSAALAACTGKTVVVGPPLVVKEIPTVPDLDVLFVVDNSASTSEKQATLAESAENFVSALDAFPAGRPNLHIGVVNTTVDIGVSSFAGAGCPHPDTQDNGRLQSPATCGVTGQYISDFADSSGGRVTNYPGDLATAVGCQLSIGDTGCGFEAPMLALQRALDGTNPDNAGFLRPDADLAIVILTDEDDCSATDPSIFELPADQVGGENDFRCQPMYAYDCDQPITADPGSATYTNCRVRTGSYLLDPNALAQTLAAIKDPVQTSVSLIAGPPETTIQTGDLMAGGPNLIDQDPALLPSCTGLDADGNELIARPAIRLTAFADNYSPRTSFQSVCQNDYSTAVVDIATTVYDMFTPCLAPNVDSTDTDPAPGLQLACDVEDIVDAGTSVATPIAIPACAMLAEDDPDPNGARPCWWAMPDPTCNADGGGTLSMQIERATPAPAGTVVRESCAATAPQP